MRFEKREQKLTTYGFTDEGFCFNNGHFLIHWTDICCMSKKKFDDLYKASKYKGYIND